MTPLDSIKSPNYCLTYRDFEKIRPKRPTKIDRNDPGPKRPERVGMLGDILFQIIRMRPSRARVCVCVFVGGRGVAVPLFR